MSTPNESNITKTPPTTHLPASSFPAPCPPLSAREVISRRLKTKIGKAEEQIGEEGRQSRQAGRHRHRHRHKRLQELPRLPHTHTDTLTYVTHRIGWGFSVAPEPSYRLSPTSLSPPRCLLFLCSGDAFLVFWEPLFNCRRRCCTWLAVVFRPILGLAFVRATPLPWPALAHLPRGVPSTLTTAALISITPVWGEDIEHAKFML